MMYFGHLVRAAVPFHPAEDPSRTAGGVYDDGPPSADRGPRSFVHVEPAVVPGVASQRYKTSPASNRTVLNDGSLLAGEALKEYWSF